MLLPLALLAAVNAAVCSPCPDTWIEYTDYCYFVSNFTVEWSSVPAVCHLISPGSQPVSIHSLSENAAVTTMLNGRSAWIGLSRTDNESWRWTDSSSVNFTLWDNGQPSESANCGAIGNSETGLWGGFSCND